MKRCSSEALEPSCTRAHAYGQADDRFTSSHSRATMNDLCISDAQIQELKKAIRATISASPAISSLVNDQFRASNGRDVSVILDQIQNQGLLAKMVEQALGPSSQFPPAMQPTSTAPGRRYVKVQILAGKAFTDYLSCEIEEESLSLECELFGQRFRSTKALPAVDVPFKGESFIELPMLKRGNGGSEALQLLSIRQPMHLLLISTNSKTNRKHVVAIGNAEWRSVLIRSGSVTISVQLTTGPSGLSAGLPCAPAGIVLLQLSITPALFPTVGVSALPQHLDAALLVSQQKTENARDAESMGRFLSQARVWYARYLSSGPSEFKSRPVKVIARCEDGIQYPVCCFLAHLRLGRQLPSPRHAARFVSLLRKREDDEEERRLLLPGLTGGSLAFGSETSSCWCLLHTTLSSGSASKEEAAVLLCGLLLGFGLDAWCVVGRLKSGLGHVWVVTRGAMAAPTFWEPLTGKTYTLDHDYSPQSWPYHSIGSVFNDHCIAANLQPSHEPSQGMGSFLFEDPRAWSVLDVNKADVPGPSWVPLQLRASLSDPERKMEQQMEAGVKERLSKHRKQPIKWDLSLEHLMMQALDVYETEAVQEESCSSSLELFQQSIRRSVPSGWQFQAYPIHTKTGTNVEEALHSLLAEKLINEILAIEASQEEYAFALRLNHYPEGLISCWMMMGVRFERGRGSQSLN